MMEQVEGAPLAPDEGTEISRRLTLLARVAFWSILLGLAVQALLLLGRLAGGEAPTSVSLALSAAQGLTWSLLVCLGVAAGMTIAQSKALIVGIFAAVCAPLAIAGAKLVQHFVAQLMESEAQAPALSLVTLAVLRGIEYGVLGYLLARLAEKGVTLARPYLVSGIAVGVIFGGSIGVASLMTAAAAGKALAVAAVIGAVVNEVVFPIGCAALIYASQTVTRATVFTARTG
jgi:hypothetical protein